MNRSMEDRLLEEYMRPGARMIAVFSGRPNFCAQCGQELRWPQYAINDWGHHASFVCKCGFNYQLVEDEQSLRELAAQYGGDL